jgi:hypothetical protein
MAAASSATSTIFFVPASSVCKNEYNSYVAIALPIRSNESKVIHQECNPIAKPLLSKYHLQLHKL